MVQTCVENAGFSPEPRLNVNVVSLASRGLCLEYFSAFVVERILD